MAKPGQEEREKRCIFIVPSDLTDQERNLLVSVEDHLKHVYRYEVDRKTVEDNQKEVKKLGRIEKYLNKYGKIVLVFPGGKMTEGDESESLAQLRELIKTILQHTVHQEIRKRSFVYSIMYGKDYDALPSELQDFNIRRFLVSAKQMLTSDHCAEDIASFLEAEPDNLDIKLTFRNFGNGLAWSFYIGYLSHMLPDLKHSLVNKRWYQGNPDDIQYENISTRMLIYPRTEQRGGRSERMIIHQHEKPKDVAAIDRRYEADVREVRAREGDERYFGVADFVNCLQLLIDITDDKTMSGETESTKFFSMNEEDMNKQARYFSERLKLILDRQSLENLNRLMHGDNTRMHVDPSMFMLLEYKDTIRPATLDEQADFLFEDLKEASKQAPESMECDQTPSGQPTAETGVLFLSEVKNDVMKFVREQLKTTSIGLRFDQANELVGKSKNILLVLTDALVQSDHFEDLFYNILHHGYKKKNSRFLVCLDCLTITTANQPALGLLVLFKRISYKYGWQELVKAELEGDPQEIGHSLLMRNVGTGLALSYYYRFLKIRFPDMKTIVSRTPGLEEMVKTGRMSYKLFILLPTSHETARKLSQADPRIKNKDEADDCDEIKNFQVPEIERGRRKYTPQLHSIEDTEENGRTKYLAFVEYNTQSNTFLKMKKTGVMDEHVFAEESEDFINKLRAIVDHKHEPAGLKHWLRFLVYDDQRKGFSLADYILAHVKCEIRVENGRLPVVNE